MARPRARRWVLLLARERPFRVLHQADWIAFQLSGRMVSDANNALKTGYDPVAGGWPDWLANAGIDMALLPRSSSRAHPQAPLPGGGSRPLACPSAVKVVAGTTDGCASFLATGATEVTASARLAPR